MINFSRNTIIELIRAFNFQTHAGLQQIALQYNLEEFVGGGGIESKVTILMQHLIHHPELKGPGGSSLILELTELLLDQRCGPHAPFFGTPQERFPGLVNALKQDGYVVDGLKLRSLLPDTVLLPEKEDQLMQILNKHGFSTAKGHLEQAIAAHTRSEWAAANSQLRTFIEELFDQIAWILSEGSTGALSGSHARREWLATCSPAFFEAPLNEWEMGGKGGFVQGLWRRLQPAGSHPGLSDEVDSTFRLHLVIIVAGYYLNRLDCRAKL